MMIDLINRIREWFKLRKRMKEILDELKSIKGELKSVNKRLDGMDKKLDNIDQTLKTFIELSIPVFRKAEGGSPQADELEEILRHH